MIRVLILEDNKESLKAITAMVRQVSAEIEVLPADSVLKAQTYLDQTQQRINAFLLDINLDAENENDQGGIEFARKIRNYKAYAFTPIVMITSIANLELQAYRELHCYQYIIKPYEPEELMKQLPEDMFIQTHRMFVVNKDHIESVDYVNRFIQMKHQITVEIGVTHRNEIKDSIN